jgi:hypothetical protein
MIKFFYMKSIIYGLKFALQKTKFVITLMVVPISLSWFKPNNNNNNETSKKCVPWKGPKKLHFLNNPHANVLPNIDWNIIGNECCLNFETKWIIT